MEATSLNYPPISSRVAKGDLVPIAVLESTPEGGDSLPCLNSDISIENCADQPKSALVQRPVLSVQHRRSAFILQESVRLLIERYGIQFVGFLTLTFGDHVTCPKEAQRRLNSLLTNVINDRYRCYLGVFERQKSGRIHYHLLVVLHTDIRTGVRFDQLADRDYSSAPKALRDEWAFWRKTAKKYGFNRHELLPVRTSVHAMAKYVGKYIGKHIEARDGKDKGVRLVRYARSARAGTSRFQFVSPGSAEWRRKVAMFAGIVQAHHPEEVISGIGDLTRVLGPRWAYHNRAFILAL